MSYRERVTNYVLHHNIIQHMHYVIHHWWNISTATCFGTELPGYWQHYDKGI